MWKGKNIFGPKKFLGQTFFLSQQISYPQKMFVPEKFWARKMFWAGKFFRSEKNFGPKIFFRHVVTHVEETHTESQKKFESIRLTEAELLHLS